MKRSTIAVVTMLSLLACGQLVLFGISAIQAALLVDSIPGADAGLASSRELDLWRGIGALTGTLVLISCVGLTIALVSALRVPDRVDVGPPG